MTTPADPTAFFRQMLGEWEKMANGLGGEAMKSEEWARAMHGASSATTNMQAMVKGVMERALAAANMPSRTELEDVSARLARIEAALARIEAAMGGAAPARSLRPGPPRTRKPASTG